MSDTFCFHLISWNTFLLVIANTRVYIFGSIVGAQRFSYLRAFKLILKYRHDGMDNFEIIHSFRSQKVGL